jgi:ferric-dicitrate binding protein FerR (iron transport regulator)
MKNDFHILAGKFLSGNASEAEIAAFREALNNGDNRKIFEDLAAVWEKFPLAHNVPEFNADKGWHDLQARLSNRTIEKRRVPAVLKIAAGFILIFSLVALIMLVLPGPSTTVISQLPPAQESTFVALPETPALIAQPAQDQSVTPKPAIRKRKPSNGLISMVTVSSGDSARLCVLPDNSHVYLNKGSVLNYPSGFEGDERLVELSGEAFFEVTKSSKPFRITCGRTVTSVLGTSFNIKGYNPKDQVNVIVVTGLVQVTSKDIPIEKGVYLRPGDAITYKATETVFVKATVKKKDKWWEKSGLRRKLKDILTKLFGKKNQDNDEKH